MNKRILLFLKEYRLINIVNINIINIDNKKLIYVYRMCILNNTKLNL